MSGHSKWAQIKRKKAKEDTKRGKIFTKLIREITIIAREGGGDADANARLRTAIQTAKAANMPADNIERAIKRGTGELPGVNYEELQYEGYGPGGAALLIDVMTDNTNRSVSEIRHLFNKHGGNLGDPGCVAWIFDKKGVIHVERRQIDEDALLAVVLEAGADDVQGDEEGFAITCEPEQFEELRAAVEAAGIDIASAEVTMVPKTTEPLAGREAERCWHLYEALEELDSVEAVYGNFDIPEEILESVGD